jgi:hypothetical protein
MFMTIPQYPKYEISKKGEVRNISTKKILKQKFSKPYFSIGLYSDDKKIHFHNIHRLVALAWLDTPSNYKELQVAHNDGNSENNHFENLAWKTPKENTHDKYKHNSFNSPHGEKHHNRKLNDDLVVLLRKEIKAEDTDCKELSIKYDIKKLTLYDAVTGKTWKHLNIIEKPADLSGTQYKRKSIA